MLFPYSGKALSEVLVKPLEPSAFGLPGLVFLNASDPLLLLSLPGYGSLEVSVPTAFTESPDVSPGAKGSASAYLTNGSPETSEEPTEGIVPGENSALALHVERMYPGCMCYTNIKRLEKWLSGPNIPLKEKSDENETGWRRSQVWRPVM